MFDNIYKNKKVLITGHTGFVGSWLLCWLQHLGAEVFGFSNDVYPHYSLIKEKIKQYDWQLNDIREENSINKFLKKVQPEIIFHLAAQPLVGISYKEPYNTFETNVQGTLNLLEVCRKIPSLKSLIVITTDKVFKNKEILCGYKEEDELEGYDPYSCSKVLVEHLVKCYKENYFKNTVKIATVRAGNIAGGGDFTEGRIIPDIINAKFKNVPLKIRNLYGVRPFSHVLDIIYGYLLLGQKHLQESLGFEGAWNFSDDSSIMSVEDLVNFFEISYEEVEKPFHETNTLILNCDKAKQKLEWSVLYQGKKSLQKTLEWYTAYFNKKIITMEQICEYETLRNN